MPRTRHLFVKCVVLLAVLLAIGSIYTDALIRQQYEGKKWALPAQVYARPLQIYPGLVLPMSVLRQELNWLGYQAAAEVKRPGQFRIQGNRVTLYRRHFDFADNGLEAINRASRLTWRLEQGQVAQLQRADEHVDYVQLEPLLIGGIYPKQQEDRLLMSYQQLPELLVEGLIVIEDRSFWQHYGVSLKGIARAALVNLQKGRWQQGGSTLTQQLIKNFYLNSERSLRRKALEAWMALLLELHYSKQSILETYANEVYLGQAGARAIHGFALASQHYFGRGLDELKPPQLALLVGMLKGPSYYDPWRHPERALERRNLVLQQWQQAGLIGTSVSQAGQQSNLQVIAKTSIRKQAYPAFLAAVKRQLQQDYPDSALSSEGLRIFTSLDPVRQQHVELQLSKGLQQLERERKTSDLQGAVVMVAPDTGEVLALVGDREVSRAGFNRALDARRQIGSLIKPLVYLLALEQPERYSWTTPLSDAALNWQDPQGNLWAPQNFDGQYHGQQPMYRGLVNSYNVMTARLALELGLSNLVDMLARLGLEQSVTALPALSLGALDLSPWQVAGVYQTIAAQGFHTPINTVRRVVDNQGQLLQRYPYRVYQRVESDHMHLLHYGMQMVMREGTGKGAYQWLSDDLRLAGKTGTSDEQRDSWFAGFDGRQLVVVWVGRDDNKPTPLTGSSAALPIWSRIMVGSTPQSLPFVKPESVAYHWIDRDSGLLSEERCRDVLAMPFLVGSEPIERAPCRQEKRNFWQKVKSWWQ